VLINVILYFLISAWLVIIAVLDIRRGEVSNWLTIPPLLIATLWQAAHGGWAILILFVLVLFISEWPVAWPLGIAAVIGIWPEIARQGLETAAVVWIVVLILWVLDVLGGADVKAAMTLAALFPDSRLAWLMVICWWALSMVLFLKRYGRSALRVFAATAVSLSRAKAEGHRAPALPALSIAGLVFLWLYSPQLP